MFFFMKRKTYDLFGCNEDGRRVSKEQRRWMMFARKNYQEPFLKGILNYF